nr:hypothetical protein [Tanacetum cinerariifolium]
MAPLPPRDRRHAWLRYEDSQYTNEIIMNFEESLSVIFTRQVNKLQTLMCYDDAYRVTPRVFALAGCDIKPLERSYHGFGRDFWSGCKSIIVDNGWELFSKFLRGLTVGSDEISGLEVRASL